MSYTSPTSLETTMNLTKLLSELDAEIARLKAARQLLTTGSKPVGKVKAAATPAKKKRKMSAEGRARIIEGQKRRWARQKKAAASNGK
jgi:hypothetical protein